MGRPNYFASDEVAARYERVRPFFHDRVATQIRDWCGSARLRHVLDVGCGTGQSATALAAIAERVTAIDASAEMIARAAGGANVEYKVGVAEQLPFAAGEFDLVTAGSALHWFDQRRFFGECRRVLLACGVVAVYNDHFTTHMEGSPAFHRWMRVGVGNRYPPVRGL